RVEREHAAVLRRYQRVDLDQRAILGEVEREEIADERGGLLERLAGQAEAEGEPAGLEVGDPQRRMGPLPQDPLGRLRRDLLDLHAARLRGHDDMPGARAVEGDREVELAIDRGGL